MGVNKHKKHVWVVPEDDANRQLVNGFCLHPALNGTCIDVRPASGGWLRVLADFEQMHASKLREFPLRHLVLMIDFDDKVDERSAMIKGKIPADVADRVYVLGLRGEPEPFRKHMGKSLEKLGEDLAAACTSSLPGLWAHDLLKHNHEELVRLTNTVKPFLFN